MSADSPSDPDSTRASPPPALTLPVALLGLAISAVGAAVRLPLLGLPLERDEGEYAYAGQLLLDGVAPYSGLYSMKPPGIYVAYAAVMGVFGETPTGIHTGLLLASALSAFLVFLIARRLTGTVGAVAACLAFGLLSVGLGVQGPFANAEHFVLPCALGALLAALHAGESGRLSLAALAGLLAGVGFVVKQQGGLLALGVLVVLLIDVWRSGARLASWPASRRRVGATAAVFLVAAAVPYGLTCAWMASAGVFDRFWFLTVTYASEYGTQVPLAEAPAVLADVLPEVTAGPAALWLLAAVGLLAVACAGIRGERQAWVILPLFAATAAAVAVGLYFRPHYFVLFLPVVALLVGVAIEAVGALLRGRVGAGPARAAALGLLAVAVGATAYGERRLVTLDHAGIVRYCYGGNPFLESEEIGALLRERMKPDERVLVLGSEPQIPFYAGRRSATGYVYMYPLMEPQPFAESMQREMLTEIEEMAPRHVVMVASATSWLAQEDSVRLLFDWIDRTLPTYRVVRVIDLPELAEPPPGAPSDGPFPGLGHEWIAIYER